MTQRKNIFVSVVIILPIALVLAFLVLQKGATSNKTTWETAVNDTYDYSIAYPKDWKNERAETIPGIQLAGGDLLSSQIMRTSEGNDMSANASIAVSVYAIDPVVSLETIQSQDEDIGTGSVKSQETIIIDGYEGRRYLIDASAYDGETMILDALIRKGDWVYEFEGMVTNGESYEDFEDIMSYSLESLSLNVSSSQ